MSTRMSSFAVAAILAGAAACGGEQSQQPANAPNSGMTPASPDAAAGPTSMNAGAAAAQVLDQPGSLGPSGARGPEEMSPGATDQPSARPPRRTTGATGAMTTNTSGDAANGGNQRGDQQAGVTNEQGDDVASLNDDQLAGLVLGIHRNEIARGELAETTASSPAVKRLAERLVGSNRTMISHDRTVWQRSNISPNDSVLSKRMKTSADSQLSNLRAEQGREFDATYLEDVINGRHEALKLIDRIIAATKSADFKTDLQAERARLDGQLAQAEQVRDSLRMSATPPASTAAPQPTPSYGYSDGGMK